MSVGDKLRAAGKRHEQARLRKQRALKIAAAREDERLSTEQHVLRAEMYARRGEVPPA